MFRSSAPLLKQVTRKLKLTPKHSPKDYYKGYGSGAMGRHTKHGGYVIEWHKVRTYVVPPGLDDTHLTPFVTNKVEKPVASFAGTEGPMDGNALLEEWKARSDRR